MPVPVQKKFPVGMYKAFYSMNPHAQHLIELLELLPHPEGGYYRETYRSGQLVTADGQQRPALTTIYYLMLAGDHSRWHAVDADEIWHFYQGTPLELFCAPPDLGWCNMLCLGPNDNRTQSVHVIPKGCWQAARTTGDYTLVGCTVAPGFRFSGFQFLADLPDRAAALQALAPDLAYLL